MAVRDLYSVFVAVVTILAVSGCSHPDRRDPVPADLTTQAVVPGMPQVRYWIDRDPEPIIRDGIASFYRQKEYLASIGHVGPFPPVDFLSISGGGDNGAFGAGLLVGWSAAGTRPEFKLVTGISTGALTAPFAFLGPDYDDALRQVFTTIGPEDVLEERSIFAAVLDDAMADNQPLWDTVSRYANEEMLEKIAYEYEEKGRLLVIGTTDIDARQAVAWNIGAIAASGHPKALELFRKILVASAAIPGVFPPTMIDVEVNGQTYQEMHVDGGAMSQAFVYPGSMSPRAEELKRDVKIERSLYIIRNDRLDPEWARTERQTLDIAGRSISSLIHTQGIGDIYKIYLLAQRDDVDFNLAFIGADFSAAHPEEFDTEYMEELFDYGYQLARNGYRWSKLPPGYVERAEE